MKKMLFSLVAMLTIAVQASAMSYEQARIEALFLTDKMAYELNLTDIQYEAAYEINLDYLMGVTSQYDVYGPYWERRNLDLSYILFSWQWDLFRAASYFFRPLVWDAGYWHFSIYARYPHRDYFYFGRPAFFATYRGGHSWRMNNGHSYYEGHRDHYRPEGRPRDQHFGMRNSWDRGDYRGGNGQGPRSSTHITGGQGGGFNDRPNGPGNDNMNRGGFGSGRNGNRDGRQPGDNNGETRPNGQQGGGQPGGGRPEGGFGSRSNGGGSVIQGSGNMPNGGTRNSNGSFGGNRSGNGNAGAGNGGTIQQNPPVRNSGANVRNSGGEVRNSGGNVRNSGGDVRNSGGTMRSSGSFNTRSNSGGNSGGGSRGGSSRNSSGNFGGGRR